MATNAATRNDKWPVLLATGIGNIVEWYDFVIFGTLATFLAHNFFPNESQYVGILSTFAAFGVAFLFRPLGGILFGHIGDRAGRKVALGAVIIMTSVATCLIGFIPSYETIGLWAPIILVLLRCIQGLGAGGEMSGTASYLIEYASPHKRGLYASSVGCTVMLGILVGLVISTAISAVASDYFMTNYGWRILFWIAGPFGLIGVYIRVKLDETSNFEENKKNNVIMKNPLATVFKKHKRSAFASVIFTVGHAAGFYFLMSFMINYLIATINMPRTEALLTNMVAVASVACIALACGYFSDRYGRRPLALGAFGAYLVLIGPAFLLINTGNFTWILVGQLLLSVPAGMTSGLVTILQVELFPSTVRYSGAGATYNIGQVLGGAFTPLIATWLVAASGEITAFVYLYLVIITCVIATFLLLRETRPMHVTHPQIGALREEL